MTARYILLALLFPIVLVPRPACGQSQTGKAALDPVGVYELMFEAGGHQQPGELTITTAPDGKLSGSLSLHGHVIPLESIVVQPGKSAFSASAPDGHFTVTLNSDKDKWTGTFATDEMSGTLTGVRRK